MAEQAQPKFHHKVTVSATLTLNEAELGALDALAGYGHESFLKVFYEKMGEAYMKPHEAGLISLFKTIKSTVPSALRDVRAARSSLLKEKKDG